MAKTTCTLLAALVIIALFHDLRTWRLEQAPANDITPTRPRRNFSLHLMLLIIAYASRRGYILTGTVDFL